MRRREIRLERMPPAKKPTDIADNLGLTWKAEFRKEGKADVLILTEQAKDYDEEGLLKSLQTRLEAAGGKVSRVLRDVCAVFLGETPILDGPEPRAVVIKATVVGLQRFLVVEIINVWSIPMAFQFGLPEQSMGDEGIAAGQVVTFLGTVVPYIARGLARSGMATAKA